ncbi:hypothetical protein [Desulfosporosinus acidiphilus]|nr:hypothetical protein [Desulfosporosinus acidiphilus]
MLMIFSLFLCFSFVTDVHFAYADSLPSSASSSYYVTPSWTNSSTAYSQGQSVTPGYGGDVILDFGRQYYNGSTWGTYLPGTSYFVSDSQIQTIVHNFLTGYDSAHTQVIFAYIATNNDNVGWSQGSTTWTDAGTDWGALVDSTPPTINTAVGGGNDIESWYGTGFIAYGSDTVNWCNAYNSRTHMRMLNYGSDASSEYPSGWTKQQVYSVSWGLSDDLVMPEIYYNSQASQWQGIYDYNTNLYIWGTTSEYGYGGSLSWSDAWNALNNAITNDPTHPNSNDVQASATNI